MLEKCATKMMRWKLDKPLAVDIAVSKTDVIQINYKYPDHDYYVPFRNFVVDYIHLHTCWLSNKKAQLMLFEKESH